jgi:hypothetical protein
MTAINRVIMKDRSMSCWNIRIVAALLLLLPSSAYAQETMTVEEPFNFGLFSLQDNDTPHTLIVSATDNSFTPDPAFVVATPPQRGEYFLEGFVPGTEINVTVADGGLTLNGGGGTEVFATIDYTVFPTPVIANGSGEATVFIGATLRTLGDGMLYNTGSYSDDLDITFDWIP